MALGRLIEWGRLAATLPEFLRETVTPASAAANLKHRLERREENLSRLIRDGIYGAVESPYRHLLDHAGFDLARVLNLIQSKGVEEALLTLRDAGVFLSLEEFKGQQTVQRGPLEIRFREVDLDNPVSGEPGLKGASSGTRSNKTTTTYHWGFLTEEAENECLLYETHGLLEAPTAFWYPADISIAGMHNLLLNLKHGHPPERWFTPAAGRGTKYRLMLAALSVAGRATALRVPWPETVLPEDAESVAQWMSAARKKSQSTVLRTFTSSAVRAVQAGMKAGIDLSGCTVFAGGEPFTDRHLNFFAEAGVKAFPRYVSTESGLIGGACPERHSPDEMHVYLDRVAVIPGAPREPALVTTILPSTSKILLNASLGDSATLERRECGCAFGCLGMDLFISDVRSSRRMTMEGMTVLFSDLDAIVGDLVRARGGSPDDYQFCEHVDGGGAGGVEIVVSPELVGVDDGKFMEEVTARLKHCGPGGRLASRIWRQTGALRLARRTPVVTQGNKLPRWIQRQQV